MKQLLIALVICFVSVSGINCGTAPAQTQPKEPGSGIYKGDLKWAQIEHILHSSSVGRVITLGEEYPYSVPVSFVYFEGKICIHSSQRGTKIENIKKNDAVCFAVDRYNEREGWASINIFGRANVVNDAAKRGELMAKFEAAYNALPDKVEPSVASVAETKPLNIPVAMIEIIPEKITNRVLSVPPSWLTKFPYIVGKIPGDKEIASGAHGGSAREMPQETIKWTLLSCAMGRLNTFGLQRRLAPASGKYPDSTPVNYSYFDGKVYIHSRNYGAKIDNLKAGRKVTFSVDRFTDKRWLSVNVFGSARLISDPDEMAVLMGKYTAAFNNEPEDIDEAVEDVKEPDAGMKDSIGRMAKRMVLIEITPEEITGRTNNVKLNTAKLPYTLKDKLFKE
ncbi:MAG: pyridoxamine 5'-phosphate oxidase family protein [Planctomycetota bacterium]